MRYRSADALFAMDAHDAQHTKQPRPRPEPFRRGFDEVHSIDDCTGSMTAQDL